MQDDAPATTQAKRSRAWRLIVTLTGFLVLPGLGAYLAYEHLETLRHWGDWIRAHLPWTALLLMGMLFALLSASVTPTFVVSAFAGWCLGVVWGFPVAIGAIVLSSMPAYFMARRFAGDSAMAMIREHPRWARVHAALLEQRFAREVWIITLLRLPPLAPFAFTNAAFAAMDVAWPSYVLGTFLGMMPRTLAVVFIADQWSEFDPSKGLPTWYELAGAIAALAAIAFVGALARRELKRVT